jgi:hypothetical protein
MDYYYVLREFHWNPDRQQDKGAVPVVVPRGFVTDLASIPRPFWSIAAPTGKHGQAAIFHDWLYWQQAVERDVADHTFGQIMKDLNVPAALRSVIVNAVKMFGGSSWDETRLNRAKGERRILRLFPNDPRTSWKEWRMMPGVFA